MSLPPTSLSGFIILSFSSRNSFWFFRCPDLVQKPGKDEPSAFPISLMDVSLLFQVLLSCCSLCWPLQHLESSLHSCPSVWFTEHTPSLPVFPGTTCFLLASQESSLVLLSHLVWMTKSAQATRAFRHLSFQTVCSCCLSMLTQPKNKLFIVVFLNLLFLLNAFF